MGRYVGNGVVVRCKFGERLTGSADANAERNLMETSGTCRDYNHPPKAQCNGEGIVQTTNIYGGESRSGRHNSLVGGSNPSGRTKICKGLGDSSSG